MSRVRLRTAMPLLSKLRTPMLEHTSLMKLGRIPSGDVFGYVLFCAATMLSSSAWVSGARPDFWAADNAQLLAARLGRRLPVYFVDLRLREARASRLRSKCQD